MKPNDGPRPLSKSKLVSFRQCPKRLWLEVHRPELRQDSPSTLTTFRIGHELGALAQQLYDPMEMGFVIDLKADGVHAAVQRTGELISQGQPIFEAGFVAEGVLAFADVLLPTPTEGPMQWRMVEIKSSTSVKPYQIDDVAIQRFAVKSSGVSLASVAIAYIDKNWVYAGHGDYRGLLIEQDLTTEALQREDVVRSWIAQAQLVASALEPPAISVGAQCESPFRCGFKPHCTAYGIEAEYPVEWLPRIQSNALKGYSAGGDVQDMRQIPEVMLSHKQRRVRDVTLAGAAYFDAEGACSDLLRFGRQAYLLNFETIQFGVPRWAGTRPFQMVPFQFSLHRLDEQGTLTHQTFLDVSGEDPSRAFSEALIGACSDPFPIFVYNIAFEGRLLRELALRLPALAFGLNAVRARLVDLLPIAERRYYHPSQKGSWSIKKLLPAIAPERNYGQLHGVQDGAMAMEAYLKAIAPGTTAVQVAEISDQLYAYCKQDTLAMVEVWRKFSQNS